jgi:beta-glucosidase
VVVGGKSGLVEGCTSGESIDCADLGLPGVQQALVEAVVATGTPTVVALINGRPLAIPWIAEHVPAILEAWLPGEEGGHAVADVLFGDAPPGGKLPISFPRSVGQVPVYYGHKPSGGRSQWRGDYADLPRSPPLQARARYTHFSTRTEAERREKNPGGTVGVRGVAAPDPSRRGSRAVYRTTWPPASRGR